MNLISLIYQFVVGGAIFFGGQRFSWWLITFSCMASVVGSYSFIKYSAAGFRYGMSSSMSYLNHWIVMSFLLLGWLPIIHFYFRKKSDKNDIF